MKPQDALDIIKNTQESIDRTVSEFEQTVNVFEAGCRLKDMVPELENKVILRALKLHSHSPDELSEFQKRELTAEIQRIGYLIACINMLT